jgi:hypothetical protein
MSGEERTFLNVPALALAHCPEPKETREVTDATKDLQDELASELERRRESSARSKELKEQLKTLKGKGGKKAASLSTILSASSSGRVRSVPAARAGKFAYLAEVVLCLNPIRSFCTKDYNSDYNSVK